MDRRYFGGNHFIGIDVQLEAGVRAFDLEVWPNERNASDAVLCAGSCGYGPRTRLADVLKHMAAFLRNHSRHVLLVALRQNVHVSRIVAAVEEAGVIDTLWVPRDDANAGPPTLQALIARGVHMLLFTNRASTHPLMNSVDIATNTTFTNTTTRNTTANSSAGLLTPPWLVHQWDWMESTGDRGAASADGCDVVFGASGNGTSNRMLWLNHYDATPSPNPTRATELNAKAVLADHYWRCSAALAKQPNVVSVDFWSVGNPLYAVHMLARNKTSRPR
jgi:hypothetical protein